MRRGSFIRSLSCAALCAAAGAGRLFSKEASAFTEGRKTESKSLIAYFSRLGNTRALARQISLKNGADIFEIKTRTPHTDNYDELVKQTYRELENGLLPEIAGDIPDLPQYGAVYVGYPVWCTDIPPAVQSFLAKCDLSGKDVIPFCSYYSTRWGKSLDTLKKLCPHSNILDGIAVKGVSEKVLRDEVSEWLESLGNAAAA